MQAMNVLSCVMSEIKARSVYSDERPNRDLTPFQAVLFASQIDQRRDWNSICRDRYFLIVQLCANQSFRKSLF
jgi:hypothetical protein